MPYFSLMQIAIKKVNKLLLTTEIFLLELYNKDSDQNHKALLLG